MPIKEDSQLISDVQEKYGVGKKFAISYLDYWFRARGRDFSCLSEIINSPQPEPTWFEFAMSTNQRGEEFAKTVAPHIPTNAKRYLDVGCGFGGFLVGFSNLALEVVGIEIDPERIEFAEANTKDHGLSDCVFKHNILLGNIQNRLGSFDIITCSDVIEHVLDVPKTISNMVGLLNPGGILVLKIPNKNSINFVGSDGHFRLFGITLLKREDAMRYFSKFFNFEYDVGYYFDKTYHYCPVKTVSIVWIHPVQLKAVQVSV